MSKSFKINAEVLRPALAKLGRVVPSRPANPVTKNLLLRTSGSNLELIATNNEITLTQRILLEQPPKESIELLIPYDLLNTVARLNAHNPLEISVGKTIIIHGYNDAYEVKTPEKVSDFPKLLELPKKSSIDLTLEVLPSLKKALDTTLSNTINEKLSNVLLQLEKGKLSVASSDMHALFLREFPAEVDVEEKLLVSPKLIEVLDGQSAPGLKLWFHSKAIGFESPTQTVVAVRPSVAPVDFRAVIPTDWPVNLILDKRELVKSLEKCQVAHMHVDIRLKNTAGMITLSADGELLSTAVTLDGSYTGEVEQITVNTDKLITVLEQIEAEQVSIAIHQPNRAIVFSADDFPGYTGLLMPIFNNQKS